MSTFCGLLFFINILLIQNARSQYVKRNTYDPSYYDMGSFNDPFYATQECNCREFSKPEQRKPRGSNCNGLDNCIVEAAVVEEQLEVPVASSVPVLTAVGFGNDVLAVALSPLLEAADADVSLLMFTKIKSC